ncbi:beta-galactoside alpha-2,6-sialyltransferase 1-like isoform X2 [Pseudophryne corroboree]
MMICCNGKLHFIITVTFCLLWIVTVNVYFHTRIKDGYTVTPIRKCENCFPGNINDSLDQEMRKTMLQKILLTDITRRNILTQTMKNNVQGRFGAKFHPKQMTSKDLTLRLRQVKRNYQAMNKYSVNFKGKINQEFSPLEIMCQLKYRVNMTTIMSSDLPASANFWSQYLPSKTLEQEVGKLGRCAIVMSAGAMRFSKLGKEIDSHDAVLRFNIAPTDGFETDVGSKTTFRILNSQVVTLPNHHFLDNPMYKKGILLMWDPLSYETDIHQMYKPEFRFFERYINYSRQNPDQPFYILNPKSSWQLWNIIQENSPELIQPNPPSSGSLGILLMMNLCEEVNVYEFLPSMRQTDQCYYYKKYYDRACTFGAYHPLIYEKNLIIKLNLGDDNSIVKYGKVTLSGLRDLQCKVQA